MYIRQGYSPMIERAFPSPDYLLRMNSQIVANAEANYYNKVSKVFKAGILSWFFLLHVTINIFIS